MNFFMFGVLELGVNENKKKVVRNLKLWEVGGREAVNGGK